MTNFWTNFSHNCRGNSNILLWWFHLSVLIHTWQNFFSAIQNTISEPRVFSYLPNLLKEWRRLRLNFWTVDNLPADLEVGPEEEVNFVVLLDDAAGLFASENRENKVNKDDKSDTILPKGAQNGNVKHHLLFTYLP